MMLRTHASVSGACLGSADFGFFGLEELAVDGVRSFRASTSSALFYLATQIKSI